MKYKYMLTSLILLCILSNANSAISDIVLANSVKDFSMTQGQSRWYYGFYDGDSSRPYTNSDFEEFPKHGINMHGTQEWYIEHFWHENRNWSSLWAVGGHPHANPDHWVVRRWHSSYEGPVQITGKLAKIQTEGGDGTVGHILIDGKEIWSQELAYNDGTGVEYTVNANIKVHSLIDFAISPKRNQHCNGTTFTAVIKPVAEKDDVSNNQEILTDSMEILSIDPPLPATLKLGEKLNVRIKYALRNFDSVHIWARPYTNGSRTSGYAAHPSPSYRKSDSKTGIAEGWFYFDRPTIVDEIRVDMKDVSGKEITISKRIDAKWISDKSAQSASFPDVTSFNGHYYKLFPSRLEWDEAQNACEKMGGNLACITSSQENDFIVNLLRKRSYPKFTCCWIGGRQDDSTLIWTWTTGEPIELKEKLVVEDNHEHFLNLRLESGLWEDYPISGENVGEQWFICEWSSFKSVIENWKSSTMPIIVENRVHPTHPKSPKSQPPNVNKISIGEPFPELEFKDLNDKTINITDLKGKVVLIDFWATWCGPCKAETPNLLSVYNDYKEKGLEIIGINLDKDKQRLTDYLEEHEILWPNYYDGKGWDNEISRRFGIHGIPKILLIDNKGIVREVGLRGEEIRQAVEGAIHSINDRSPNSGSVLTKEYTIQEGDSLWQIAESKLGDGKRYKEILKLNPQLKYGMKVGEKLKIPITE